MLKNLKFEISNIMYVSIFYSKTENVITTYYQFNYVFRIKLDELMGLQRFINTFHVHKKFFILKIKRIYLKLFSMTWCSKIKLK